MELETIFIILALTIFIALLISPFIVHNLIQSQYQCLNSYVSSYVILGSKQISVPNNELAIVLSHRNVIIKDKDRNFTSTVNKAVLMPGNYTITPLFTTAKLIIVNSPKDFLKAYNTAKNNASSIEHIYEILSIIGAIAVSIFIFLGLGHFGIVVWAFSVLLIIVLILYPSCTTVIVNPTVKDALTVLGYLHEHKQPNMNNTDIWIIPIPIPINGD